MQNERLILKDGATIVRCSFQSSHNYRANFLMPITIKLEGHGVYTLKIPNRIPFDFQLTVADKCRNYFNVHGTIYNPKSGHAVAWFEEGVMYELRPLSVIDFVGARKSSSSIPEIDFLEHELKEKYDLFAEVCGPETYVPNRRIRDLVDTYFNELEVQFCVRKWESALYSIDTIVMENAHGEATPLTEGFMHKLFSMMAKSTEGHLSSKSKFIENASFAQLVDFSSLISQHSLQWNNTQNLSVDVVSGFSSRKSYKLIRECFSDILAVAGSTCIELHRMGLSREDCVIPVVALSGARIQFLAVHLMSDCFPVLVALSPELPLFGTFKEQEIAAQWCMRVLAFGRETSNMMQLSDKATSQVPPAFIRLNVDDYFPKPVRYHGQQHESQRDTHSLFWLCVRCDQIMQMYERLRVWCRRATPEIYACSVILFPKGVTTLPAEEKIPKCEKLYSNLADCCARNGFEVSRNCRTPLILFPRLSKDKGWSTDKPDTLELRESYVTQLRVAVDALNTALIAHLDLHPGNIMWRHAPTKSDAHRVELRVIDFDYAVLFSRVIPEELVQSVVNKRDRRYPFKAGDEENEQIACEFHNNYFLEGVSGWVHSEIESFYQFMSKNADSVLCKLLQDMCTLVFISSR